MARNNRRENSSRISHDYKLGDKVLFKKTGKHLIKLGIPRTETHKVYAMCTNVTLHIKKIKVDERVNIKGVFPYFEHADH
jgi:hypothetical protein